MSTHVAGPTVIDGLLTEPTAFFAMARNSYVSSWVRPVTMKRVSVILVRLALDHLELTPSLFSMM